MEDSLEIQARNAVMTAILPSQSLTIEEFELQVEALAAGLRRRKAEAAIVPLTDAEARAIHDAALAKHSAAQSHKDRHAAAAEGLLALESRKYKGREVDILAHHVITAREAMSGGSI